jgi:hypothetical protein
MTPKSAGAVTGRPWTVTVLASECLGNWVRWKKS